VNAQELYQRLYEIDEADAEKLRELAAEIATAAREPARAVLDVWAQGASATPCAFVCIQLRELAYREMLRRAETTSEPGLRVQLLEMVVDQQLRFREQLLAMLQPDSPQAYVLIRRLVEPLDADADPFPSEEEFLALDPPRQRKEMKRWAESRTWQSLFDSSPD